ncbi:MAG: glycosyltransferase [Rectinemataceae bacterium]
MSVAILSISLVVTLALFMYGYNCYYFLYQRRRYAMPLPSRSEDFRPGVAVHLPIYNERYVVSRLVEACVRMAARYGVERTRIVVIDDSDDDTAAEIDRVAADARSRGFQVEALRREGRDGFKAGALQYALERTAEEFIAIFDADFIPDADFLAAAIPYFGRDRDLGIVQSRWEHLNEGYSALTRAIALGIDVHFLVEQPARSAAGCFLNFNGSGGIIRREALVLAGGWQADTLAEDLDMSYRLQIRGSRILYLRDLRSPAEIPSTLPSYKRQQARWANGSLRTARKLMPELFAKRGLGFKRRVQGFLHLTYYMVQPLMFVTFLLTVLSAFLGWGIADLAGRAAFPVSLPTLGAAARLTFAVAIFLCTIATIFYPLTAIRARGRRISDNASSVGILILLGFGLTFSNSVEAAKALFSDRVWAFSRTPKYAIRGSPDEWKDKRYQVPVDGKLLAEACLALVGAAAIVLALRLSSYFAAFFLLVYTISFAFVAALSFLQSRREVKV